MRQRERAALERLSDFGGAPLVRELTALFLEQTLERLAVAHAALQQRDADSLAASAHSIRSSSAQLGAHDIVEACESLEDAAESGDLGGAAVHLREMTTAFESFRIWLASELESRDRAGVTEHAPSKPPRSRRVQPVTIAVIEDNVDNRLLIDAILGELYALDEYATGAEALSVMPTQPPSLVLLDVSLPGMDGLDVLAHMKRDATLRDVPVVAVTAHAMAGDRERYLAAGFDGYVAKPIVDERVLLDTIARLLRDSRPVDHQAG